MGLVLKGQKINLRSLRLTDAKAIYQEAKVKDVSKYTNVPHPYSLTVAQDFIKYTQTSLKEKKSYELGVFKKDGTFVGMSGLTIDAKQPKIAEIGYWLGADYRRQGLISEAVSLLLKFGFSKLGLVRVYAKVMHPNQASGKLLVKAGFVYEGRLRKEVKQRGRWLDSLVYSRLKSDL